MQISTENNLHEMSNLYSRTNKKYILICRLLTISPRIKQKILTNQVFIYLFFFFLVVVFFFRKEINMLSL